MRTLAFALILAVACGKANIGSPSKTLADPGEKIFTMHGKIVSRDASSNSLTIDHKEIPGLMEAMTMDYAVRDAKIDTLPANGSNIVARVHVTDEKGVWITDVKATP
jgi:Cu/Ag efflux protein CusF